MLEEKELYIEINKKIDITIEDLKNQIAEKSQIIKLSNHQINSLNQHVDELIEQNKLKDSVIAKLKGQVLLLESKNREIQNNKLAFDSLKNINRSLIFEKEKLNKRLKINEKTIGDLSVDRNMTLSSRELTNEIQMREIEKQERFGLQKELKLSRLKNEKLTIEIDKSNAEIKKLRETNCNLIERLEEKAKNYHFKELNEFVSVSNLGIPENVLDKNIMDEFNIFYHKGKGEFALITNYFLIFPSNKERTCFKTVHCDIFKKHKYLKDFNQTHLYTNFYKPQNLIKSHSNNSIERSFKLLASFYEKLCEQISFLETRMAHLKKISVYLKLSAFQGIKKYFNEKNKRLTLEVAKKEQNLKLEFLKFYSQYNK